MFRGRPAIQLQTLSSIYAEKLVFENKFVSELPVYKEELALILNAGKGFSEIKKDKIKKI